MNRLQSLNRLPYHILFPLAFFFIGLIYLYAVPHFESPDSITHIAMIRWVSEHNGELPVQSKGHGQLYGQQASQPPLYYFLMMPVWSAFDTSDFEDVLTLNPHAIAGWPSRLGNRNLILYDQAYPPLLKGTSLAVYSIRLITLVISSITVFAVYKSARVIFPEKVSLAVMATALTAFNPQFLFIGSSVSNDNLVTMFASLITWQMLLTLRDGFNTRRSLLLAVLVALGTLSKLNGLVLVLAVALGGLWLAYRTRNLRGLLILGTSMAIIWLIVAGWWYIRNLTLYHELFGTSAMVANYGGRKTSLELLLQTEFAGFRQSYWGLFGWFSIFVDYWFYLLTDVFMALSLIGMAIFVVQARKKPYQLTAFCFLTIIALVGMAMLIWWTSQTTGSQGRLIFPYITAFSILMAIGLSSLRIPAILIALPLMAYAIYAPFAFIIPEYDQPQAIEQLPASATSVYAQFEDIRLIGYEIPQGRLSGGDSLPITLYWQVEQQSPLDYSLFIHLIDDTGRVLARITGYPGWGSLRTSRWQTGAIYPDRYILQIPTENPEAEDEDDREFGGFSSTQIHVGWWQYPDGDNIRPVIENGESVIAFTMPAGVFINEPTGQKLENSILDGTSFGDAIELTGYQLNQAHELDLQWKLLKPISGDLRVFAFVLTEPYQNGGEFNVIAQADVSPRVPLSYLNVGESILTHHAFTIPDDIKGTYPIYIGWYDAENNTRLAVPYPADMYPVTELRLET